MKTSLLRSAKFAVIGLAGLAFTSWGQASTLLSNVGGGSNFPFFDGSVGYSFTLSSNVTLNQLGIYDVGGDGLANQHFVAVYDSLGNDLADFTFTVGTMGADAQGFIYATPSNTGITLTAGTYILAASYHEASSGGDSFFYNDGAGNQPSVAAGVILGQSRYGNEGAFPTNTFGPSTSFVGPNLTFSAVPEPSTYALFLGGAMLLFVLRRRCV